MQRRGKKYQEVSAKVERGRRYPPDEGVAAVKTASLSKFDGAVEAHIRLGVDPRKADEMVRGSVILPHGTGKKRRVLVFTQGEKVREATEAGADYVGGEEYAKKVQEGWLEFDVALATPDMMGMVGRLGKVLGPRGLMPNPKSGTVTFELAKAIRDIQGGRIEFRVDKTGIIHTNIGKVSYTSAQLQENLAALMEAVVRAKPAAAKGVFVRAVHLAPTMGPSVPLDPVLAARLTTAA